ncbi:hypothetical protein VNO80_10855 [Phaseolus coccineus]|uniref:Uncharacterized protein n=1 Tax=Phaseolus coccineus TaxID=3886 RepID=A0AAN9REZ7_PHACN
MAANDSLQSDYASINTLQPSVSLHYTHVLTLQNIFSDTIQLTLHNPFVYHSLSTMANSTVVFTLVAALLVTSALAQSPASSPALSPKRTPVATPRSSPSPALSPSAESPSSSPPVPALNGPSPSPTGIDSPPLPPSDSPAGTPSVTPSAISAPPTEAPTPSQNGAALNRFTLAGSAAAVVLAAVLFM